MGYSDCKTGRLKETPPQRNLPEDPHIPAAQCDDINVNDYCLLAGDERVMEQPSLSMIHTVFMREHNRIATILASHNPSWTDERIFQETRKIIAAEMQHITFNEYLPLVLGPVYMSFFGLYSSPSGFSHVYSRYIDASIVNVFETSAYRYGHSQVPNILGKTHGVDGFIFDHTQLDATFFQSNMILKQHGADRLASYAATVNSQAADGRIEQSVLDNLFRDLDPTKPFSGLDLPALNIQRGRDHGLPPYNAYRSLCGRHPYSTWFEARHQDHSDSDLLLLQNAYRDPADIDVFTGAITEKHVPGGIVGPTNACLIANQFRKLKLGDRFFYENPFERTGFRIDQLNSIKRISLAKIICMNMNLDRIQPNVFRKAGPGNPLTPCHALPGIDIHGLWSGNPHYFVRARGRHFDPPLSPASALRAPSHRAFLVPSSLTEARHI